MNKVVVYGLGKAFDSLKEYIEIRYEIVGFCDKNPNAAIEKCINKYIYPEKLNEVEYDFIFITSTVRFAEIKENLITEYSVEASKIIGKSDLFCGSFENAEVRHSWVKEQLSKIPAGKIILDAGAGEQRYAPYCKHLKYIAQDFGEYDPAKQTEKMNLAKEVWDTSGCQIVSDIIDIPLEDETVDVILCTEVLEHLKDPVLAIKEFSRLLTMGGQLILTAPFCSLTHMAPYYYSNGFSQYWYKEHLEGAGFEIEEVITNGNFFKYLCQELYRVNDVAKTYCGGGLLKKDIKVIAEAIDILLALEKNDKGSDEILCYGYMIVARKQ